MEHTDNDNFAGLALLGVQFCTRWTCSSWATKTGTLQIRKNPKTYGKAYGIKESDPQAGPQMLHGGGAADFFVEFMLKARDSTFYWNPTKAAQAAPSERPGGMRPKAAYKIGRAHV